MLAIDAIAYWQCVSINQPNGWGQHVDTTFTDMRGGRGVVSHCALRLYCKAHGEDRFNRALDVLFSRGEK